VLSGTPGRELPTLVSPNARYAAALTSECKWLQSKREEYKLSSLRIAHAAYNQGDHTALFTVQTADSLGRGSGLGGSAGLLPRPEAHSVYSARNHANYNEWV